MSETGAVIESFASEIISAQMILRDQGVLHGLDYAGTLQAIKVPIVAAAAWSFQSGTVSACLVELPFWPDKPPAGPVVTYRFDDTWPTTLDEHKLQVIAAMDLWGIANQREELNLRFEPVTEGQTPTVVFKIGAPPAGDLAHSGRQLINRHVELYLPRSRSATIPL